MSVDTVGRLKSGPETDLVARYADRIKAAGKQTGITSFEINETTESRATGTSRRKREEADALLGRLSPGSQLVVFDEQGKSLSSADFANWLDVLRTDGTAHCTFMIGGPDGLDEAVRDRADLLISFGRLTIPHQLVRVLVCEQIYRSITILNGHPYHRQ